MNKYYNAIDSVHAKQSSVEKALAAARTAEQSGKVIEMTKTKKRFNFKAVSAIAACLVAVIAGSAIFSNSGSKNSFIIKANAATLNSDSDVYIGKIDEQGGSFDEKVNDDGSKEYSYSAEIALSLDCEGENIKSVKYTGKNCKFYNIFSGAQLDKSYKVDYDEKRSTNGNPEVGLIATAATDDKDISVEARQAIIDWNNHASYKLGEPVPDDYDDSKFDINKSDKALFSHLFKNTKIKAEIKFKDGTVKTETIKLICKRFDKNGGVQINAKID